MKTEDFDRGDRVRVDIPGHFLNGMIATVTNHDAYTVEVRFDTITPEMKDYEDTRIGLAYLMPTELKKI